MRACVCARVCVCDIIPALTSRPLVPIGAGGVYVWNELIGWQGTKLRPHVGHPQPIVSDRKPAAAAEGGVRCVSAAHTHTHTRVLSLTDSVVCVCVFSV